MQIDKNHIVPAVATPLSGILENELEERKITLEEFATTVDIPIAYLSELLDGKHAITPEIAQKFEQALDIPVRLWLNLQQIYEYDLKAIAERSKNKRGLFHNFGKSIAAAML